MANTTASFRLKRGPGGRLPPEESRRNRTNPPGATTVPATPATAQTARAAPLGDRILAKNTVGANPAGQAGRATGFPGKRDLCRHRTAGRPSAVRERTRRDRREAGRVGGSAALPGVGGRALELFAHPGGKVAVQKQADVR